MGKPSLPSPSIRHLGKSPVVLPQLRLSATDQELNAHGDQNAQGMQDRATEGMAPKTISNAAPVLKGVGSVSSEGRTGHANEDRCLVRSSALFHLMAVMDGHGGAKAAEFLVEHLFEALELVFLEHDERFEAAAVIDAVEKVDEAYLEIARRQFDYSGACLNVLLLYWDRGLNAFGKMVLNVGDCRAIACELASPSKPPRRKLFGGSDAEVVALSIDHSVGNRAERVRALKAGASIQNGRIAGVLEPFRTIGDLDLKGAAMRGWVIPTPDVHQSALAMGRTTIVLATDGVWSVLQNARVMKLAHLELFHGGDAQSAAEAIAGEAREIGSQDDITVIVVSV